MNPEAFSSKKKEETSYDVPQHKASNQEKMGKAKGDFKRR
jgi:hypothetical protein